MSRKKGNRTKRKAREYYELQGWIVDDCEKSSRYAKNKDLFNLFDLVAIKGTKVCFIQVKTNKPPTLKTYKEWAEEHCNEYIHCEGFTWFDYDGPIIHNFRSDGKIEEYDLRKVSNAGKKMYKETISSEKLQRIRHIK